MRKETQPERVSKGKMLSFGMGPFTNAVVYMSYNYLVFYYYEVELGLATALVGLSFIIFAVWNMVNDPLLGFFTDKPRKWSKKYGLRFPWVMFGGALQIVSVFLLFWIPNIPDPKTDPIPLFIYMVIVTCLFDTFFSIFHSNYVGGFANIFKTPDQRRTGSTTITFFAIMGRFLVVGLIIPFVIVYGDPTSYVRVALVLCILLTVALILFIPGIYESEEVKQRYLKIYEFMEAQKMPYFKLLKTAFKDRNWVIYIVVFTLQIIASFLNQASSLYFVREVLGQDIAVVGLGATVFTIAFIPSMFLWTWVAKKTAHSNVSTISLLILAVVFSLYMVITDVTGYIIVSIIGGCGSAAWTCILFSFTADSNDSVCNEVGRHVESTLVGIRNFFNRIAYIVVGGVIAGIHLWTGYVPGASQQTPFAQMGIRLHAGLVPLIVLLIAAFLMIKFYDLKGDKKTALLESMRQKGL